MYRKITPLALMVILLFACAIRLYAPYDLETDVRLKMFKAETDGFYAWIKDVIWLKESEDSKRVKDFYDNAFNEIGWLETRAEGFLNNKETTKALKELKENFVLAKKLHEMGFSTIAEVQIVQNTLASHFRALISLEDRKKRGEEE